MKRAPEPLYRQIAHRMRARIQSGALKPGDALPTEMALCEREGVSRHTAREALRLLAMDGLIERRRGAGTLVAEPPAPAFEQSLNDIESILQYAQRAVFQLDQSRMATRAELEAFNLAGDYTAFIGLRAQKSNSPVCRTRIFVMRSLAPDTDDLPAMSGSISEWIEATHAITILTVEQRMEAVALTRADAARLGLSKGFPALRTLRRYKDARRRIVLISENLHPAGRFAYEMVLERQNR